MSEPPALAGGLIPKKPIFVKTQIQQELLNLEKELNIKIVYAVESGSRAWGFASQDSDWDVRFIYLHRLDWYLSINDKKDSFERMLPRDLDLSGWEMRKTLKLFRKSNPPLLEWLQSPIVYMENSKIMNELRALITEYFNPKACLYHYFHMAEGNFREYLQRDLVGVKKYFYVLRPILACRWIEREGTVPPIEFYKLVETQIEDKNLRSEIDGLLARKIRGDELHTEPKIPLISDFITGKITYYRELLKTFPVVKPPDNLELDKFFKMSLNEFESK